MPGQVSSASTAHHSRPMTRTGRTRKGRLISPRLATKDSRLRSAFFTTRTVPFFTRTTNHGFALKIRLEKNPGSKNHSIPGFLKKEPRVIHNIPHKFVGCQGNRVK